MWSVVYTHSRSRTLSSTAAAMMSMIICWILNSPPIPIRFVRRMHRQEPAMRAIDLWSQCTFNFGHRHFVYCYCFGFGTGSQYRFIVLGVIALAYFECRVLFGGSHFGISLPLRVLDRPWEVIIIGDGDGGNACKCHSFRIVFWSCLVDDEWTQIYRMKNSCVWEWGN